MDTTEQHTFDALRRRYEASQRQLDVALTETGRLTGVVAGLDGAMRDVARRRALQENVLTQALTRANAEAQELRGEIQRLRDVLRAVGIAAEG